MATMANDEGSVPDLCRLLAGPATRTSRGLEIHPRWIDSPAEFQAIDFTDPGCPAWAFDDSLAARPSDLRAAIEANQGMGG